MKTIWVVEADSDGYGLYNALEQVKQIDGWVNYVTAISDQYLLTSLGPSHTAYLTTKLAQGFLERRLTYPVHAGRVRVDSRKTRTSVTAGTSGNRGVTHQDASVVSLLCSIPGVHEPTARAVAQAGYSVADLVAVEEAELKKIRSVGPKQAKAIKTALTRRND